MATHQFIRSMVLNSLFQNKVNLSLLLDRSIFILSPNQRLPSDSGFKPKMVYLGEEKIDGYRHELDFEHWNTEQGDPSFI